jgi:N-6 DNA Methylase
MARHTLKRPFAKPGFSRPDEDFHRAWLGMVQPIEGLVFSIPVLVDAQCVDRKGPAIQERLRQLGPTIPDLDAFLSDILGYAPDLFDRGASLPADLSLYVPEGGQTLVPTLALRKISDGEDTTPSQETLLPDDSTPAGRAGAAYEMLIWDLPPGMPLDEPESQTGQWRYPPAAKFDRLLRHCRVDIGLLTNRDTVRLIYAPHGEATGSITFPISVLADTGGRIVLDAFVRLLSADSFFRFAPEQRLRHILRQSRKHQDVVTTKLAGQVLEALEILLRGFETAANRDGTSLPVGIEGDDDHLYGGLLTVLLRGVFLLYAEDRGLLPTDHPHYARHLSLLGLFDQLQDDANTFPDTMARRFGAWGRMIALFRAAYLGVDHEGLSIPARRGELFDPSRYAFLEGWVHGAGAPINNAAERSAVRVPSVDDGTVYQVLDRLLYLDGQRLSYRALDVEQIGSVYEALMGFKVERLGGAAVCLRPSRVWVAGIDVLAEPPSRRGDFLAGVADLEKSHLKTIVGPLKDADTVEAILAALDLVKVVDTDRAHVGQLVLQPGKERRKSGSHYTPRSLSEPIVRRALEPLLAAMSPTGEPSSERLLELKICDPAMGSGAFLVEACRFMGDQVVAAWTREGRVDQIAAPGEDVVMKARRLVAQRCLYGVDKNPFAVHLAKLSLWLVTLARDQPFTFLDHSLRHGDSLVGLSLDQLRGFHWKPKAQLEIVGREMSAAIDEALLLRQKILELARESGNAITREKERLLWDAEDALDRVRVLGDLVVGAFFEGKTEKEREAERLRRLDLVTPWLREGGPLPEEARALSNELRLKHKLPPFHWMVEYPEIFYGERPDPLDSDRANRVAWMDAFIGNPPFMGKNGISDAGGVAYLPWLQEVHEGAHGNADLSAHFFRRGDFLLGLHGTLSLIATNTIAQGDTRATALKPMVDAGCVIYDATRSMRWPGLANVAVSVIHLAKGHLAAVPGLRRRLDGREVAVVNSRLRPKPERADPTVLVANANLAYQGSIVLGMGFTLTSEGRDALVAKNPRNAERIFPYLGGEEVNTSPTQMFDRYVINFGDMALEEAEKWPDLIGIVREKVKPERDTNKRDVRRKYWWRFGETAPALYAALRGKNRCLVISRHTKHLSFSFQPSSRVFSEAMNIFSLGDNARFAVLQSRIHETWARLLSSSLEDRLRYSVSDCFDTFPFPSADSLHADGPLETIGARLYETRAALMAARNQGLTTTYNHLKDPENQDPEILALRRLHEDLDRAVLAAYGWPDIPVPPFDTAPASPTHESFSDEILDRLFALNAERAEQERLEGAAASVTPKSPKKVKEKAAPESQQLDLAQKGPHR